MMRMYCTVADVIDDLNLPGVKHEELLIKLIRGASEHIEKEIGMFIPVAETRVIYPRTSGAVLLTPPYLSITRLEMDGVTLDPGSYHSWPPAKHWPRGPYTGIEADGFTWSSRLGGIMMTGSWGSYEAVETIGGVVSLTIAESVLQVQDGTMLSPGMALLIGTEQIQVIRSGPLTTTTATLTSAINDSDQYLQIFGATALFHPGEVLQIGFEQLRILDIATDEILVLRGWADSARAAHEISEVIRVLRSYVIRRGVNGTTAAEHTGEMIQRYMPPEDINYLCRQIAALMRQKAATNYIGRSGNDDMGTGFWVNEFPKNQIQAIAQHYYCGTR